jgi:hypothetical protein
MGRLFVEAQGTAATGAAQGAQDVDLATPGNSRRLPLVVSVTDDGGLPVPGLAAGNFVVQARLVAPGGAEVELQQPNGVLGGADGVYHVDLVPVSFQGTQHKWVAGRFIFSVAVTSGGDRGQTLCAVLMD